MIFKLTEFTCTILKCLKTYACVYFLKHDILTLKTSDLDFASSEDSNQPEHLPTVIRVFTVRTKNATKGHLLPIERTARTMIRQV